MALISINPYTNETLTVHQADPLSQVEKKVASARSAFTSWAISTPEIRSRYMQRLSDLLEEREKELSRMITLEMGKLLTESVAEIRKCSWLCRYYAQNAQRFLLEKEIDTGTHYSGKRYDPLGVILGIMPWNFPFWQVFRFAVPTVMAGNTVLLKHASNVQHCGQLIEELFNSAGFPEGIFQNLAVTSQDMGTVITHPAVKGVSLTGSEEAGKSVASLAAKHLKKTLLELGGNNAFIVLNDADLESAVMTGLKARMQNSGQSCIAAKRFIVEKGIAGEYIRRYSEAVQKLIPGNPLEEATTLAPLSSVGQAEQVASQVERSLAMGAQLITGGDRKGAFFLPTVVTNVRPGMPLFDEEVFGPVAAFSVAADLDEAITMSNRSEFGLGVSLFTSDIQKASQCISRFDEGAVFINAMVKSDPRLPFGGVKHSGYGRELAQEGIREFVNVKTVVIEQ